MPDNKQEPQFLGGGPRFNQAGALPPDTEPATDTAAPPFPWRNLAIALVALLLVALLYWITIGPSGMVHVSGRGGAASQGNRDFKHDPGPSSDGDPGS